MSNISTHTQACCACRPCQANRLAAGNTSGRCPRPGLRSATAGTCDRPHHGRADDDLELAIAVEVGQRGRRVRVRLERGRVGGEVQVLLPAHSASAQVERDHARRHVAAQVHVRAQLAAVRLQGRREGVHDCRGTG